jgi:hypothetical protein
LIRFLPTARLSTLRETAIPSRERSLSLTRARTLKQWSLETVGFLKTLLKSSGFIRRADRGKDPGLFSFVRLAATAISDIVCARNAQVISLKQKNIRQKDAFFPLRDGP